jgi:hypothetical protein
VTLKYITLAEKSDENCYIFLVDRGYDEEILDVINAFPLNKSITHRPFHSFLGNSYNVLEGYKEALAISKSCQSELIYLIEEDIFVGKDFFTFHKQVQKDFNPFCVSATRNQNDSNTYPSEANKVYYFDSFQSLGLSWKPDKLEFVVEHATPVYYRNVNWYIRTKFPNSKYGTQWSEQDGVINRVLEKQTDKMLYPYVPRAYHAGFVGYNRKGQPLSGSLPQRIAKLESMTAEEMNNMAEVYKDITPIDLNVNHNVTNFIL